MTFRDFAVTFRGQRVPHLDLIGRRAWWFALSGALVGLALVGLLVRNLNLSIDFEGGALLRYADRTGLTAEEVRGTLARFGRGEAEIQVIAGEGIQIRTDSLNQLGERRSELLDALAAQSGVPAEDLNVQDVGPTWGSQISRKAIQGLVIFLILVTVYISFRFDWKMALAAQLALLHDLLITAGFYALVGRQVTPATVIAILTTLGYSLYDTVVIFDKVKENTESTALVAKETYSGVVNLSLNQTLMRSVNTSLVDLGPILALLFFGGETLKDFAFALGVGVASGTYSSVFFAAPLLAVLKEREPRYRQLRQRAEARPDERGRLRPVPAGGDGTAPAGATNRKPVAARPKPRKRKPAAKRRRR